MTAATYTAEEIDVLAKAIARSQLIWMVGQEGLMAINPAILEDMFKKIWAGTRPEDETARKAARWMAKAVLADKDVQKLFSGPVELQSL